MLRRGGFAFEFVGVESSVSVIFKRGNASIQANLTPMIDVTFLLIVFFVLVSQIVEVEHVTMNLPAPDEPVSERAGEEQRLVINVVPGLDGEAIEYRLGSQSHLPGDAGVAGMIDQLTRLYRDNPSININLRADRATSFEWIDPVLRAVGAAAAATDEPGAAARMNLVVVRED